MKTVGFTKIVLFVVLLLSVSACSDRYYVDYRNTTEKLCNRDWVMDVFLDTDNGDFSKTIFLFYENGKYDQTIAYYHANSIKPYNKETRYDLDWKWTDDSCERIVLGNKTTTVYFDNVMVRDHYLTGVLDGEAVMFSDYQ